MFSWFTRHVLRRKPAENVVVENVTVDGSYSFSTRPTMASSLRTRKPRRRRHGAVRARSTHRV